jgi:hypothetical protein
MGGITEVNGYHDKMADQMIDNLRVRYDPTSMYARTRKDLIFLFENGCTMFCDPKTSMNSKSEGKDFAIEMFPLATAIALNELHGVVTLFCCRMADFEFGFFADRRVAEMIPIVYYPLFRHSDQDVENGRSRYGNIFPNALFQRCGCRNGSSGDPFVWIKNKDIITLDHWVPLMVNEVNSFPSKTSWGYSLQ